MSISFNKTFQSGTAFTPASSSDALLAMLFDGGGNNISLSLSSTSGTYLIFNPPGPYNDDQTDSWAFLYQYNASAVSQTVTASGATGAFCFGLDYTGVASATIAVTETTNAGGSGAIQGAPVTVPTGSTLVAVCLRLNSGSDTISSPSGVNKFAGTTSWGTPACVTEYAGAGSSITPSFTSSGLVHYLVVQFVLTPSSAGPFISSVAPDPAVEGATGVVATGATLTGATLEIEQGSVGVSQTVTATTATTATYTVVMEPGSGVQLAYTDTVYPTSLVATAAGVNSNSFSVALEPVAGILFETLASIFATIADRLEATGPSSPLLVQDPAGTSQASSTTIAATLNGVTSGNTIVAILGCDSGPATLSSIHDSNGTVTAASAYGGAGSHPGIGVYFVSGAAAGTHTLTGTWSIAEAASLMLLEFSGLGAFDVAATRADSPSNGTTATSNSLTPSQSGDLVLFAAAWQAGGEALTIGAGFSNSGSVTPAPSTIWGSNAQSNTNPVSGSATASVSDPWAAVIVAFKSVYGDLVANDQIRMSGNSAGTSAAPTGLILNADGTFYFTAGNTPANFYASAYDSVNNVWGPYALQTVASGNVYSVTVNEAGAAADVPNGGNNFSASINEQGLALSFPSSGSSGGAPVAAPALNIFPTFAGIGWPVTFSPLWNNQIQKTVTGRAVAVTYQQFALYTLKVQFSYLSSNDFNNLMGFFNIQGANLTPFLFDAGPGNDSVVEEGIGQGDGSTQVFQLLRSFGGYVEPVAACFGTCTAYVNGSPVTAIFNNPVDGYVTLNSAAAAGTVVSWSGQYYLKVRFSKGSEDIDEFVSQLYSTKSIQLETFW